MFTPLTFLIRNHFKQKVWSCVSTNMFLYFILLNGSDFSFKYIILEQTHLYLIDIKVTVVKLVTVLAQQLCSIFHLYFSVGFLRRMRNQPISQARKLQKVNSLPLPSSKSKHHYLWLYISDQFHMRTNVFIIIKIFSIFYS